MRNEQEQLHRPFYGRWGFNHYNMGEYAICQCLRCRMGCVCPIPSVETLKKYYDCFLLLADINLMPVVMLGAQKLFRHVCLSPSQRLTMLDVEGGGGFLL